MNQEIKNKNDVKRKLGKHFDNLPVKKKPYAPVENRDKTEKNTSNVSGKQS